MAAIRRPVTAAVVAACALGAAAACSAPAGLAGHGSVAPRSLARGSSGTSHARARATGPAAVSLTGSSPATKHPVIVIDPGHSPYLHAIDRRTGLNVSDYENEPEMQDVFAVARLVTAKLRAAGYRVIMTKKRPRQRISLAQRAVVANQAHAALALSIHDQAGRLGGLRFHRGHSIVYYQSVGSYRQTAAGRKIRFTNRRVAALSSRYGRLFRAERGRVEGQHVALRANVGYNLGSRGLAPGDIWMVQLLAHVPWIYNEAGGNSTGRSGLNAADKRRYADGLVAAVERCVPPPR